MPTLRVRISDAQAAQLEARRREDQNLSDYVRAVLFPETEAAVSLIGSTVDRFERVFARLDELEAGFAQIEQVDRRLSRLEEMAGL